LRDIEDALAKFDAGTYGTCERCGATSGPTGSRRCRRRASASPARRSAAAPPLAAENAHPLRCLVVAVILHEISHGVAAYWFGDDTAKRPAASR
jgi:hypothetical protein